MKDSMDFNQGEVENKSFSFRLVTSSNGNQINVKEERRFSFFFLINLLWVEDSLWIFFRANPTTSPFNVQTVFKNKMKKEKKEIGKFLVTSKNNERGS